MLIMTSAFFENAIWHLQFFPSLDFIDRPNLRNVSTSFSSLLEHHYNKLHEPWAKYLKYNEFFGVITFLQHKCILYSWNYMDIMIALFSRAIYFKFKTLYKLAMENLVNPLRNRDSENIHGNKWVQVAYDHKRLCMLLDQMERFFSPLIFGSYAVNIFYICLQVFIQIF